MGKKDALAKSSVDQVQCHELLILEQHIPSTFIASVE